MRHATAAGADPLTTDGGGTSSAGGAEGVEPGPPGSGAATATTTLSRERVFVTTKIHPRDFGAERIGAAVATSNTNLHVRGRTFLWPPPVGVHAVLCAWVFVFVHASRCLVFIGFGANT